MHKQKFTRKLAAKMVAAAATVATIASFTPGLFVSAANFTAAKDTMTRLKISTTSDHVVVFTLPTGVDFDRATQTDTLRVDFPSGFSQSGTWVAGDFSFNDGTSRTVVTPSQGAGTIDCTVAAGVNNVCIAIDTTAHVFTVKPSADYTASSTAATITFTILGTAADGTLTNPSTTSTAGQHIVSMAQCDETASCTTSFTSSHTTSISLGILDDDQVTVSATVDPYLTFDIDTSADASESSAAYSVAFGTITTVDTRVSGTTDSVNIITLEADTNAGSGLVVTVKNVNGANGLKSTSVPGDDIGSADGTIADGTENYGLCVATSTLTGFARAVPYNTDTCASNSETNGVQALTTTGENIVSTTAPVASAHAEVIANAAISATTTAHNDYADTLTFIATGTF